MLLKAHGHNVELTDSLDAHITDRFKAALDQYDRIVQEITVRLEDVNGPKGGVDKRCHVTIHLRSGSTVVVDEVQADMFAAVSVAADRSKQVVGRKLERIREK